jgi:hypothetical protein
MRQTLAILLRTVLILTGLALLVLVGVGLALRVPAVQTRVVQEAARRVSEALRYPIEIGRVDYRWFDEITLERVSVRDSSGAPMIFARRIDVDFPLLRPAPLPVNIFGYTLEVPFVELANFDTVAHLDRVRLVGADVHLIKDRNGDQNIDGLINRINELTAPKTPNPNAKGMPFTIAEAQVSESTFRFDDTRQPRLNRRGTFDYYHFRLDDVRGDISDFYLYSDTVSLEARGLQARERLADFRVRELTTDFLYAEDQMRFAGLYLRVNNSTVRDYVEMRYTKKNGLANFNTNVRIRARLDSTLLDPHDVARFSRNLYQYRDRWTVSGQFDGTVRNFTLRNADVRFGQRSRVLGRLTFRGLPDVDRTDMDLAVVNSTVDVPDLTQYAGKSTTDAIRKFGTVRFSASFLGRTDRFQTKGTFLTALGRMEPNVTMQLFKESARSTYDGTLRVEDFQLGTLLDQPRTVQRVTLDGEIEGRGFSVRDAVFRFDGRIPRIGLRGYEYRNADVNGAFDRGLFEGEVALRDSNLIMDLAGSIDLRDGRDFVGVGGEIRRARLQPLGFAKQDLTLQTVVNVAFTGFDVDSTYGAARLRNFYLTRDNRNLVLDTLYLFAPRPVERRSIQLISDVLDAQIDGQYRLTQVAEDLPELLTEYRDYFIENTLNRTAYYARKSAQPPSRYGLRYDVHLKHPEPFLAFFYPEGYLSHGARLSGEFTMGNTAVLSAELLADTLGTPTYRAYGVEVDLNTSKFYNSPEVLASAIISSRRQQISRLVPTERLDIEASWERDRIAFTSSIRQVDSPNRARLNGDLRFTDSGADLRFRSNSVVRILDGTWQLDPGNLIQFAGRDISFQNVVFRNIEQSLALNGTLSPDDPQQTAQVTARDFNLETLVPLLNTDVRGTLNAAVSARDVFGKTNLDGTLTVDEFVYRNVLVGNLDGQLGWDVANQRVNVTAAVDRMNNRILDLRGTYEPGREENSLNLRAQLSRTDLQIASPFVEGIFSDLGGTASGLVTVRGTPAAPVLLGELDVRRGKARFDYLNVGMTFEDKISFQPDAITGRFSLTDEDGNRGSTLRVSFFPDGAGSYALGVAGSLRNFKVLHTDERTNDQFYGTAYVTGRFEVNSIGSLDNLDIRAQVTSNPGTHIIIPLDNAAEVSTADYVTFISPTARRDTTARARPAESSGIQLRFDLDITPDALCELVLDRQTDEKISAYGRGNIVLSMDRQGDFEMAGKYTIAQQSRYAFKYTTLVSKEFLISPNSSITWTGSPYEAELDVTAAYTRNVSLVPLLNLSEAERRRPDFLRGYPVSAVIRLTDKLTNPTIQYQLEVREYPSIIQFQQAVTTLQARLQTDPQELSNQVGSLIALNTLQPLNSQGFSNLSGANLVGNNLAEVGTGLASQILSQIIPNFNVNVNVASGVADLTFEQRVRAEVSYNLNNRFRISRDGGFSSVTASANANLIGDWTIEWLVTPEGRLRLKGFNRFVQNPFQTSLNNQSVANFGGSVLYTRSFNHLFGIGRRRDTPPPPTAPVPLAPRPIPLDTLRVAPTTSLRLKRD